MKKYVLSPFYPVADKIDTSHRAGWARYWAKELGAELLTTGTMSKVEELGKGAELYLYHGMEWSGAMNLQSGVTDEVVVRMIRIIEAPKRGAKLISIDIPMPPYGKLIGARNDANRNALDKAEMLTKVLATKGYLRVPNENPKHLIMGDSHSLSQYRPGGVIFRADGQTLHGALAANLLKRLDNWAFETGVELKGLGLMTSYFGNIDIRHHLMRQPDPNVAVRKLVEEYGKQLDEIQRAYKIKHVEVVTPLPIENEARVLPKTGWYKGTPFYGTWQQRTDLVKAFRRSLANMVKRHGFSLYDHPKSFTNKQGELSFDVMEQPRSVHIRPSEYRLIQENMSW